MRKQKIDHTAGDGSELTSFGDKQKEYDDGRDDGDDASGQGPGVEVLVYLGVRVEILELVENHHDAAPP